MSSGEDPRVHVTVDALDFLRDDWSLTPANSAECAPFTLRSII